MTEEKVVKQQLHQSHLQVLYRCGEKFRRTIIENEREPATIPLVVGTATHATIARNLTNKIKKGTLLTKEAVQDLSRDDFLYGWKNTEIVLNDEEKSQGLSMTRDHAQDQTIKLVTAHHYEIANLIKPKAVERKWVLEAKDYDYNLSGMIDVDEGNGIRDTKTKKTNTGQREVDTSEQYTIYALAKYLIDGRMPDYVIQDNVLKPTKRRDAYCVSYRSTRTKEDFKVVMRRFDQACRIIKAGIYTPANPFDWWCSANFCGFAANGTCPYFNSKARKPITNPIISGKEGAKDYVRGKAEGIISTLERTLSSQK